MKKLLKITSALAGVVLLTLTSNVNAQYLENRGGGGTGGGGPVTATSLTASAAVQFNGLPTGTSSLTTAICGDALGNLYAIANETCFAGNGNPLVIQAGNVNNTTAGKTLSVFANNGNSGTAVSVEYFWASTSTATSAGFDTGSEFIYNAIPYQTGAFSTSYSLYYQWAMTPSSVANSWGSNIGESDISVRLVNQIGWHRDRSTGPYNAGGHLQVPIATSSPGGSLTNPFTTNGTTTVSVAIPNHVLQVGQTIQFSGGTSCNGFLPVGTTVYTVLSVIDANDFTINGGATTGSGTCGGTVSFQEYNGTDEMYGYAVSRSSDLNAKTNRFVRTEIGFNVEPNTLVGASSNDSNASHGGDGFYVTGARVPLVNNPITTNGTTTVTLAWPSNGLSTTAPNNTFTITGATAVNGFTASGVYTVISATTSTVTFSTGGATPAAGTGGGANIIVYGNGDIPRAGFECDGTINSCIRADLVTSPAGTNVIQLAAGQNIGYTGTGSVGFQGSNAADSAPAGFIGEYLVNTGMGNSNTATISIATPAVITATAHGISPLTIVYFSTTGALPTGLSTFINYYVTAGSVTANTFQLSTTMANALAGVSIATSGSQSGVQTYHTGGLPGSGSTFDAQGLQLNAGDYDCQGSVNPSYGGATSVTFQSAWLTTSGGSALPTFQNAVFQGLNSITMNATVQPANAFSTGLVRVSLSSPGMVVMASQYTFTVSSLSLYSQIRCRRVR